MVVSAYIVVVVCGKRPVGDRDCVLCEVTLRAGGLVAVGSFATKSTDLNCFFVIQEAC